MYKILIIEDDLFNGAGNPKRDEDVGKRRAVRSGF